MLWHSTQEMGAAKWDLSLLTLKVPGYWQCCRVPLGLLLGYVPRALVREGLAEHLALLGGDESACRRLFRVKV
jgi:hypothetical protein